MKFKLESALEILERTPLVIEQLLHGLSDEWILATEGPDTWSPYDIVGHLIHGEKADWITRMKIILEQGENRTFKPFDRFAQFSESKGKSMSQLLDEFKTARLENLLILKASNIEESHLELKGIHPSFGEVSLRQLLSTWVAHDLNHVGHIARVMSRQYVHEVGPWKQYMSIMRDFDASVMPD